MASPCESVNLWKGEVMTARLILFLTERADSKNR